MRSLRVTACLLAVFSGAIACFGQDAPSTPDQAPAATEQLPAPSEQLPKTSTDETVTSPPGTVTGTIDCSDTGGPARLATVSLVKAPGETEDEPQKLFTRTNLDGHFTFSGVREGRYTVGVTFSGYLNPLAAVAPDRLAALSEDARKDLELHLAIVTVTNKGAATINVTVERAAEISGTVHYDDGSPAIGVPVRAESTATTPPTQQERRYAAFPSSSEPGRAVTDDHGHFLISGLSAGEYRVAVSIPVGDAQASGGLLKPAMDPDLTGLTVYFGDSERASDAKVVTVSSGELIERSEVSIPLGTLHTVRGQVKMIRTGAAAAPAGLQLVYADTREVVRTILTADGEFEIPYVPAGNFVLQATASMDPIPNAIPDDPATQGMLAADVLAIRQDKLAKMGLAEQPLAVSGDMDGVTISVPDPPKTAADATAPAQAQQ